VQTFKQLFREKTSHAEFKKLYERECNVCAFTVRIFEKAEALHIDMTQLAADLNVPAVDLTSLKEADSCDPRLVIRLCRHLGLLEPNSCPKL
jgi:hypothetical protein